MCEVASNHSSELTGRQPALVANWKFNEGSSTTATVSARRASQNATLNAGAAYATDVQHPWDRGP